MYYTVPAQNCSASVTASRPPSSRSSASYSTTYLDTLYVMITRTRAQ